MDRYPREVMEELLQRSARETRLSCIVLEEVWARYVWHSEEAPKEGWLQHCFRSLRGALFPNLGVPEELERFEEGRMSLLNFLHAYFAWERESLPFDPTRDFRLLTDVEIKAGGYTGEYLKLKSLVERMYIYEFMRIGADITPFNTLGHICGVHYVAMYVARQLIEAGVPVDLGLISGAAAAHDIGKYGCRKMEEGRVPYLHYYYTDYCLTSHDLPVIAHIAANHSTWDLELEDLSVESLLLIYADFRTKSTRDEEGREIIHFYSLAESFDVILSKLDNVDAAKRHRYIKVYAKLRDFEVYMREHGVRPEIPDQAEQYPVRCPLSPVPVRRETALLAGNEVVEQLKQRAMDHNIRLMSRFNSPEDFGSLLESARSEGDWKNVRTYISILQEYFTYMTEEQKLTSLSFLFEMLSHPQSDIRLHTAEVMGQIVSGFREEYKKELPEDVPAADINTTNLALFRQTLEAMFHPDHKYTDQHRWWILQRVDAFVHAVMENCRASCRPHYFEILQEYYDPTMEADALLELLSTAMYIRRELCPESFRVFIEQFCQKIVGAHGIPVDLAVLRVLHHYGLVDEAEELRRRYAILNLPAEGLSDDQLSTIFLDDLKTHVSWSSKVANVSVLLETARSTTQKSRLLHIAAHFANLIKVSETVTVRRAAGEALVAVMDRMSADQRNEIVIELLNGLEIEDYQFSRFVPDYLGIILHYLPHKELDEVIDALKKMVEGGNPQTAGTALNTIAIVLRHAWHFADPSRKSWGERRSRLLGILMKGFVHYRKRISREAFRALGEQIFAEDTLPMEVKHEIALHCFKRILTLLPEREEADELAFYNNAAVLNHIYRFVSEYQSEEGEFGYPEHRKIAFFPGTFDPFSQGHKAIATTIRDMGFEVYLAIDEFSWSKKTLPHMLRKNILAISIADEEDLCIFPGDVSVNIANPKDLADLRALFPDKDLYVAVGSDVILNASSYQQPPEENSIHTFNHIVFARESRKLDADGESYPISGDVIRLSLKKYYEDISSTKIRENIDLGRDIASLIDPIVQNYIYDRNFYSREPAYKHVMQAQSIRIRYYEEGEGIILGAMEKRLQGLKYDGTSVKDYLNGDRVKAVSIDTGSRRLRRYAIAGAHEVESKDLLAEFGELAVAAKIRSSSGGKIAVIGMFHAFHTHRISNIRQMLLTELLTELAARDFTYAVYHPVCEAGYNQKTLNVFRRQGFLNISANSVRPVLAVDLRDPIVVFRDAETVIKAPLNKNQKVQRVLDSAHDRLLSTLREVYPGKLLLSFNTSAVYSKIIRLVVRDNQVSMEPDPRRRRGPYMSVPFGKALSDVVVPNTVTKAFRTEKCFRNDLSGFDILQSRDYQSLDDQARTLRSFDRPVILIDDLLHSGQRMNKIDPILRKHKVNVHKIIVGLLTGNARDEMAVRGRDVESAYFLPSISMWLNEKDFYPFIGGDSIEPPGDNGEELTGESINLLLPYTGLSPVGDGDLESLYRYSMTCLRNAADILRILETEYQKLFEKKLTLHRLGAVIVNPRYPVLGEGISYDELVAPSQYVENEIRKTDRLHLFLRGR